MNEKKVMVKEKGNDALRRVAHQPVRKRETGKWQNMPLPGQQEAESKATERWERAKGTERVTLQSEKKRKRG
jgi:hypothetical protein